MKRTTKAIDMLRYTIVSLLIAAIALLSLPFGVFKSRRANAAVDTAATDSVGGAVKASADDAGVDVDLTVYYYRKGGDYTNWDIWAWNPNGAGGEDFNHDFEEGTVEFPGFEGKMWKEYHETITGVDLTSTSAIGVIARKGQDSWEEQTADMMIPGSKIVDNAVTVYIVSDSSTLYYSAEDAMSNKIMQAFFNTFSRVNIQTSVKITDKSFFKVKDADGNVVGSLDCALSANKDIVGMSSANINLDDGYELDFSQTYTVVDDPVAPFDVDANFTGRDISFTKLFDMASFADYEYDGTLGAEYSHEETKFTVWSPAATAMKLNIYEAGEGGEATSYDMNAGENGSWSCTLSGDQNGKYYTYTVISGASSKEIVDPYARSAGRNGKRGMILDLDSTDPEGWEDHDRPEPRGSYSNAVIYEAHIRDLTMHESSNVSEANRGKFLGLTESASEENGNKKTPLDHLVSLGITELHIQPMFDFNSVDEYSGNAKYNDATQFNWGYDPLNYNVPEGSYSSDPTDGAVRVRELKEMIMALHEAGIRVIMDVVYNHVADANGSNFQALMPNYFFRTNDDGTFTSGSGCGNDTASERTMYHKFMVESVNYWADEYKIDGFRFDLMGLHDTLTMNEIYDTLAEKNPDIMVYGEGWVQGTMVASGDKQKADMTNAALMPNIAFFNDVTRDGLNGSGYGVSMTHRGFIQGNKLEAPVYIGAVGATDNSDAGYKTLGKTYFASNPTQNINYASCHDNTTLWDKINACAATTELDTLKAMNRLSAASVLTSQGPVFFLAGEELLRSKPTTEENDYDNRPYKYLHEDYYFSDNSYKSPDSVNAIDWTLADTNSDMVEFYTQLIALRKNSPQFRLSTKAEIDACVTIADSNLLNGLASYVVKDPNSNEYAVVLFNGTDTAADILIPEGDYSVYVNGANANGTTPISTFSGDTFTVGAFSAVIMKGTLDADSVADWKEVVTTPATVPDPEPTDDGDKPNNGLALGLGIGIPAAILVAGGVVFGVMYSKKKKNGADKTAETSTETDGGSDNGDVSEDKPETSDEKPETAQENGDDKKDPE